MYSEICLQKICRHKNLRELGIMIDEYDNFAKRVLSEDLELFQVITRSVGFIKDFYSAIKE